jgi:hypothetical protein
MNFNRPFRRSSKKASSNRGFAIVMALSLLSLVFLLVISLVNLVGIDLTLGDARKERVLAQAHARMGMMVAIGEIQKHLGPDTRVSATADLLDERIESGKKFVSNETYPGNELGLSSRVPQNQAIDLNENGRLDMVPFGQRYWTGVWKNRARRKGVTDDKRAAKPLPANLETGSKISGTPAYDSEYDPNPAIEVAWLVSGNEGWSKKLAHFQGELLKEYVEIPDAIPIDQRYVVGGGIYGQHPNAWEDYQLSLATLSSVYDHPLNQLPEPEDNEDIIWMLKRPLLGPTYDPERPEAWKEHISGEPVKVRKTKIRSADTSNDSLSNHGAYAYWVSDEGIKAKINIVAPFKNKNVSTAMSREDYDETRVTVALEPNVGDGSIGLNFDLPAEENFQRAKHISLGLTAEDKFWLGTEADKKARLSAHYHDLTADSYGLLSDTRTGGLKRDLSHAFANADNWSQENIDELSDNKEWAEDFQDYIFKDRIHYLKDIPMDPAAKANLWNDTAATQTLNDYSAIMAGPLWSILGTFHNLYKKWSEDGSINEIRNENADNLPRLTGDNFVVFDPDKNPQGANPFWEEMSPPDPRGKLAVRARLNNFRYFRHRPGPGNHAIQPVLLELKYSHIPTSHTLDNSEDVLALAMYPSVALWNPYNQDIHLDNLFIEVPIGNVSLKAFNPKDLDRWRKWWFYAWDSAPRVDGGNGGPLKPRPPQPPTNYPPPFGRGGPVGMEGITGVSGKMIKSLFMQAKPPVDPDPDSPRDTNHYNPCEAFFDIVLRRKNLLHNRRRAVNGFQHIFDFGRYQILKSNPPVLLDQNRLNDYRESHRHLLLRIQNLKLKAGEKAHFTVSAGQSWEFKPIIPSAEFTRLQSPRQFLQVILEKGTDLHPFICYTNCNLLPQGSNEPEPLCVKYELGNIHGVHTSQMVLFDQFAKKHVLNMDPSGNIQVRFPKGITMYNENPILEEIDAYFYKSKTIINRKPVFKITKSFETYIDSGWHFTANSSVDLRRNVTELESNFLPGNGFRIRYKLPGNSDRIVLEQYNLRSMLQSYQDGGGDNWKKELFNGSAAEAFNSHRVLNSLPEKEYRLELPYTYEGEDLVHNVLFKPDQFKFLDFYDLNTNISKNDSFEDSITENPTPFEDVNVLELSDPFNLQGQLQGKSQVVPRITPQSVRVGFFHDPREKHGGMTENGEHIEVASLFEIPTSPMLSILQFRHANLCDYSHAPSYILGNSYSTSQVGRYKTWGRMRAISKEIESTRFAIAHNEANSELWSEARSDRSPWQYEIARMNLFFDGTGRGYGQVRDADAQIDHQNTTVDHSYYANRALLDGYFMTGVDEAWNVASVPKISNDTERFLEFLQSADQPLVPYPPFRNSRLKLYYQNGTIRETKNSDKTVKRLPSSDFDFRYQTMAADLLVEGAFNINSTSVDAWISQLSSLREKASDGVLSDDYGTPFPRFVNHPPENSWNQIRKLSDEEINLLAHCLVEQIKLRGPFLTYADFVNRRVQGIASNRLDTHLEDWNQEFLETRDSVLGLRGAMQAAIAEAEINQSQFQKQSPLGHGFTGQVGEWPDNPMIPFVPNNRYYNLNDIPTPIMFTDFDQMDFVSSIFGLHAFSKQNLLQPNTLKHTRVNFQNPSPPNGLSAIDRRDYNKHVNNSQYGQGMVRLENKYQGNMLWKGDPISFKIGWDDYSSALNFGEAPENLMAVENVATAANKPGWLMQSDILSPLAPVTSARSDTFTIRIMGEPKLANSNKDKSRAWIEVTVQRVPDYVKPEVDAPHHRPHEPFEDRNFNGYWDDDASFVEHWLDLNQNGTNEGDEGTRNIVGVPDLPSGDGQHKFFADGLYSDVKLNPDLNEETIDVKFSRMGINQRFGRKFKIIKFRWIKEQDV